ncbi:MAG: hypothetical protein E7218_03795 [Anaerofustis stercorihominis]|nr:hypothetical protein [Anaerofustis stercorihominis]
MKKIRLNKITALLLAVMLLCAVIPSFSFADAIPTMSIKSPSDYYKAGDTFTATIRVSNADFRSVGFCLTFDETVVNLANGDTSFYKSATAPHEIASGVGILTPLDSGASNKDGYIKGVWVVNAANSTFEPSEDEEATIDGAKRSVEDSSNTLVKTGEKGLIIAKIEFKVLKDGAPDLKFSAMEDDNEFSEYGSFVYNATEGSDATLPQNYETNETPDKTPYLDAKALKEALDKINDDGVINNDDTETVAALRVILPLVNESGIAKELAAEYLTEAENIDKNFERMAAETVIELINSIGDVDLNDKKTIDDAYMAYDDLSDAQQDAIAAEYEVLKKAKATYDDLVKAVKNAEDAIDDIKDIDTAEDVHTTGYDNAKQLTQKAQDAYDLLETSAQKAEVEYAELEDAKNAVKDYEDALSKSEETDKLIEEIGIVTLDSENAIKKAEDAYNSLNDFEKKLVTNYAALTEARESYNTLAAHKASADEVTKQVLALEEVIIIDSDEAADAYAEQIENAKAVIARLQNENEEAYAMLDLEKLNTVIENAEDKLYYWQTQSDADKVEASINALPDVDELTLEDEGTVNAVKNAYALLDEESKAQIDKDAVKKLESAAEKIAKLAADKKKSDKFVSAVEELGDVEFTNTYLGKLNAAKDAYDAIGDDKLYKDNTIKEYKTVLDEKSDAYEALRNEVDDVIADIDALAEVNTPEDIVDGSKTLIEKARAAYNGLDENQKNAVTNYNQLQEAETALAEYEKAVKDAADISKVIKAISDTEKYSAEWVSAVETAWNAYNNAGAFTKSLVSDADKDILTAQKAEYDGYSVNIAAAKTVIDAIDGIGNIEYITSSESLTAVRSAYDALKPEQKALVTNYSVLTAAEDTYKALADKVQTAITAIDAIKDIDKPEDTIGKKDLIVQANVAYDALTQKTQQDAVEYTELEIANKALSDYESAAAKAANIDSLITAIASYTTRTAEWAAAIEKANAELKAVEGTYAETLVTKKEELKAYDDDFAAYIADKAAAENAQAKIDAIGTVKYTKECKQLIDEARMAYDALSDTQKSMLTNADALTNAEDAYAGLHAQLADVAAKLEEVKGIEDAADITTENIILINDASAAYGNLSDELKESIDPSLAEALTKAKAALDNYNTSLANVQAAKDAIDAITEITLSSEEAILDAESKVLALNEFEQTLLNPEYKEKLDSLRAQFDKLTRDNAAAVSVIDKVNGLGSVVYTEEYLEKLTLAQTAYDALTNEQKALVDETNADETLASAKEEYDLLEKQVEAAHALIEELPEVKNITLDDEDAIKAVRKEVNKLTKEQQVALSNLGKLVVAENRITNLKAAAEVEKEIDELPDVALFSNEEAITAVKEKFDALTDEQKALVANADKLQALTDALEVNKETVKAYIENNENALQTKDETNYLNVNGTLEDFLTVQDKDDIVNGKAVIYTVIGKVKDEKSYTQKEYDAIVKKLALNFGEQPADEIFEVIITKTVSDMVAPASESAAPKSVVVDMIPGTIEVEFIIPERMYTKDKDITREFSGFVSGKRLTEGQLREYTDRVEDTDENANTITFTADGSVTLIPTYTDTINPVTGDTLAIYGGAFAVLVLAVLLINFRRRAAQ